MANSTDNPTHNEGQLRLSPAGPVGYAHAAGRVVTLGKAGGRRWHPLQVVGRREGRRAKPLYQHCDRALSVVRRLIVLFPVLIAALRARTERAWQTNGAHRFSYCVAPIYRGYVFSIPPCQRGD